MLFYSSPEFSNFVVYFGNITFEELGWLVFLKELNQIQIQTKPLECFDFPN